MNKLLVKKFNGEKVYSFIWKGKPCWVAIHIADILGYSEGSKTISACIKKEMFEIGVEYHVLTGEELKNFKSYAIEIDKDIKYAPKLILFYENGLYGFLQYTHMEIGVKFRRWLRREVLPEIREKGTYSGKDKKEDNYNFNDITIDIDNNKDNLDKVKNKLNKNCDNLTDNITKLKTATDSANAFKNILDDLTSDPKYKLSFLKTFFSEVGIVLPLYVDDEDII